MYGTMFVLLFFPGGLYTEMNVVSVSDIAMSRE